MLRRNTILLVCAAVLIGLQIAAITAQQPVKSPNPAADWPMFSHDLAGNRFSPLKQINPGNVSKLKLAWRIPYRADRSNTGGGGLCGFAEGTPVLANDLMDFASG